MLHYSRLQLATIVAVPIVSIILIWTVVIFYKNRKNWRCFDTAIVAIIVQSIFRNVSIIVYTVLQMIEQSAIRFEYCTVFVWIFNSIHTFQASTLSTLAVIALFSIRLYRKRERLKNYLTVAHMVYHLFCLTTLCACVGVAAILAKQKSKEFATISFDFFPLNLCKFMPYEMDVKYNVFIITLHSFLAFISLVAFVLTCYNFYACKKDVGFEYVKKSNSDLSELSLASQQGGYPRHYLEVYKNDHRQSDDFRSSEGHRLHHQQLQQLQQQQLHWNSDTSNISTTVSSTNSRRPCLGRKINNEDEVESVGLETILPILTVCYLFNHVPVIVLCLFPWFISPWSVATAALCLGLLQDILVPLSLGLVDTRFCQWVSNVYRCSNREKLNEKLPQVGLDGKFRPFGGHHHPEIPQQSEIIIESSNNEIHHRQHHHHQQKSTQLNQEPKFPITNGSLYTSIDGRVPIIHNYRRHKGSRNLESSHLINLGVHATYLRQQELQKPHQIEAINQLEYSCSSCDDQSKGEMVQIGVKSHQKGIQNNNSNQKRVSLSQNGLNRYGMASIDGDKKVFNHHQLRLSKSEDSLEDFEKRNFVVREDFERKILLPFNKIEKLSEEIDSDEDSFSDSININKTSNFDSDSSTSSFSITTEANGDFDFYEIRPKSPQLDFITSHGHETFEYLRDREEIFNNQIILKTFKPNHNQKDLLTSKSNHKDVTINSSSDCCSKSAKFDVNRNFKITRSNSKRSLENFRAFIDSDYVTTNNDVQQRSYSYLCLDETSGGVGFLNLGKVNGLKPEATWSGLDLAQKESFVRCVSGAGGSVPDLKKIFISDYL
ncbi:uncharacterized protein [Onthophagus taurus]|uniref:uncharacterized protein n=1 Tax=Onthophagus taurus TaxID=166361 RepID=UPI000C202ADE|nr:uncharacterized protein LOC111416482 [Onthophagus taurus]